MEQQLNEYRQKQQRNYLKANPDVAKKQEKEKKLAAYTKKPEYKEEKDQDGNVIPRAPKYKPGFKPNLSWKEIRNLEKAQINVNKAHKKAQQMRGIRQTPVPPPDRSINNNNNNTTKTVPSGADMTTPDAIEDWINDYFEQMLIDEGVMSVEESEFYDEQDTLPSEAFEYLDKHAPELERQRKLRLYADKLDQRARKRTAVEHNGK
jgi:hypothetical protein